MLGFAIRTINLDGPSIWIDEIITDHRAEINLLAMLNTLGTRNPQAPLYYALMHFWVRVSGSSVFALRFPSALFGTLVISQIYVLGKMLFDVRIGRLGALLGALSPFLVFYSRMARGYPLLWTFMLLASLFFLHVFKWDHPHSWIGYVLAGIAGLYTHLSAALVLAFIALFFILHRNRSIVLWKEWGVAQTSIVFAYIPFVFGVFDFNRTFALSIQKNSPQVSILWSVADVFVAWNSGHAIPTTELGFLLCLSTFGILSLASIVRISTQGDRLDRSQNLKIRLETESSRIFIIGYTLIPVLIAIIAKALFPSLKFSPRTLSVANLTYSLILAQGMVSVEREVLRFILLGICSVIMLWSLIAIHTMGAGVDWPQVADYIEQEEHPKDVIFVHPNGYSEAFQIYYDGSSEIEKNGGQFNAENVGDILSPVIGASRVWTVTINEYNFDPQHQMTSWLSKYCNLQRKKDLIPKHATLRLWGQCTWNP